MVSRFEQFSGAVSCIYRCIQKIERVEMAKYGLKGPHAQCLLAMCRHPEGITSSELCNLCDKDKAAISRTLAELEEAGMVQRQERGGNRYRASLMLTDKGREAAASVNQKAQQAVEVAGEGLDDAQREVFYRVLALIAGNLHAICKDGLE